MFLSTLPQKAGLVHLAKYQETLSWRDLCSKTQFAAMNDASNVALGSMLSKKGAIRSRYPSMRPGWTETEMSL